MKDFLIFTTIQKTQKISVSNECEGTIVEISVPSINTNTSLKIKNGYFRFRINNINKQDVKFIQEYKPKNTFFQSIFTATEVIDLRVNEKRNFTLSLIEKIKKKKNLGMKRYIFY